MDIEIGTDIVQISEFKKRAITDLMFRNIFTDSELRGNVDFSFFAHDHLAGIFAAKEAFMKAYGKKVDWHDIWIEKNKNGKPILHSSLLSPYDVVKVSISHDGHYAVATVLLIKNSVSP